MNVEIGEKFLRLCAVVALVGLSKSSIYAMVRAGTFPKPFMLGKRAARWRETEVLAWMAAAQIADTAREVKPRGERGQYAKDVVDMPGGRIGFRQKGKIVQTRNRPLGAPRPEKVSNSINEVTA